jgi:hypothetical protein
MAEQGGMGKPSIDESQPSGASAAGSSRPVFISYASHDVEIAQKVCSILEAAGFPCWIAPRNVVAGTLYADGIVHAIDESSILVLILSEQAVASAHVGREIERAVSKRHPVVALRIDAAPLAAAFEYFLNQSRWIEGGGSDAAISQLVSAVGQHLAPGTATLPNGGQASAAHRKAATPWTWIIAAVVVAVALAGGYFLIDKAWRSKHDTIASTAVISDKSIAESRRRPPLQCAPKENEPSRMSVDTRSHGPGRCRSVHGRCGRTVLVRTPRPMTLRVHLVAESTAFTDSKIRAEMAVPE